MGKLTDLELQSVQLLKRDTLEIASTLGELTFQKMNIDLLIEEQKEKIKEIKQREIKTLDELKEKYGTVSINIETGEFQ
jgi:hypothetical protein